MDLTEYKKGVKNPLRQATLCFLIKDDEVLLAMKKRGFGKDRWNGVGGKVQPEESIEKAAIRETKEEINVDLGKLDKVATLNFYFENKPEFNQQVIVYFVSKWDGEPEESEEMNPKWFKKVEIPLEQMWPDDYLWLPKALNGIKLEAEFLFGENDTVLDSKIIDKFDII